MSTLALARVTAPRVPRAVHAEQLIPCQPRQTLTRARGREEVLAGGAGGGALVTLTPVMCDYFNKIVEIIFIAYLLTISSLVCLLQ